MASDLLFYVLFRLAVLIRGVPPLPAEQHNGARGRQSRRGGNGQPPQPVSGMDQRDRPIPRHGKAEIAAVDLGIGLFRAIAAVHVYGIRRC